MAGTLWAAFAGSAYGQEITLHETEREALDAVVSALGVDEWIANRQHEAPDEDRDRGGEADDLSDDEIRQHLDDYCSLRSADWHVNEVEIP